GDPAARRHPHHNRAGEIAIRAIAQPRGLRDDLIVRRIHVVGELNLDARAQSIGSHADRRADDPELANRRIETAGLPVFRLQALGCAKDATEINDTLAEHDDVVVSAHHHAESTTDARHADHW